jgi:hypothetical protein
MARPLCPAEIAVDLKDQANHGRQEIVYSAFAPPSEDAQKDFDD